MNSGELFPTTIKRGVPVCGDCADESPTFPVRGRAGGKGRERVRVCAKREIARLQNSRQTAGRLLRYVCSFDTILPFHKFVEIYKT